MIWNGTAGTRVLALAFLASAAGLAGCADIDDYVTGTPGQHRAAPPPDSAAAPESAPAESPAPAPVTPITAAPTDVKPVPVQPGTDTGTPVGQKVQSLRSDLQGIGNELTADTQKFDALKGAAAQSAATYHESTAHIGLRLQVGTTPGNPDLVNEWNKAQSALDALAQTIDGLNGLASAIAANSTHARAQLDATKAAYAISGGVDEDRHQLAQLQDETTQTIIVIDRLNTDVTQESRRQAAYLSSERTSQVSLQTAIAAGDAYGAGPAAPVAMPTRYYGPTGAPIATIDFAQPNTSFQQSLYNSLTQALAARPGASFNVVAVAPTRKTADAMIAAQTEAQRHAQDVVHAMTGMGVPAARLAISSSTDPSVSASQVRVYER